MAKNYLTQDRLLELQNELKELKTSGRKAVSERLKGAKEFGDLSENSEYAEAKEEQDRLERRIFELEEMLKNVAIIKKSSGAAEIGIGSTFVVSKNGKEFKYQIVGSNETRPEEGKISNESPLGRAFLGKKVGETVSVQTPTGNTEYKIVSIE